MNICINCGEETCTPDFRTGELHKRTGKYACYDGSRRLDTVADGEAVSDNLSDLLTMPEYDGAF